MMIPWIFVLEPLEPIMADYKRTFDAWADGGVRGIVVGRMSFVQDDGTKVRAFGSDPKIYESFGLSPPEPAPRDLAKEKQLHAMLDDAASRGWHIMIFASIIGGEPLPIEQDPYRAVSYAAGVTDLKNAMPQIHGHIADGPAEKHYELAYHHGGMVFEIADHQREQFQALGYDVGRMERGMMRLRQTLHKLTPGRVRYHAPGGMLAALELLDINEDTLYWLRARQQSTQGLAAAYRKELDKLDQKIEWGLIPRTAAFASMTGHNYCNVAPHVDYLFPKHYFWHRGFDGMYGTVARWVQRLHKWNPSLTEPDCFDVVKMLFGIDLPQVRTLMDMERGFSDEFFDKIVYQETLRALEAVGDVEKTVVWMSTGRSPHAGDAMPVHDLRRMLESSERAGLKRFVFHSTDELGAAEWNMLSAMCGRKWDEDHTGYWPADTPKPDSFSGGRAPPAGEAD